MRLSLRIRLLIIIGSVLLLGMAFGALLLLQQARTSVEVEMRSNLQTVQQLIGVYLTDPGGLVTENDLNSLVGAVSHLRHVHAMVEYTSTRTIPTNIPNLADVPDWFVRLVAPPVATLPRIVLYGPGKLRRLRIETNPTDEIQEVWHDLVPLVALVSAVYLTVCILVYWALGRGLKPLDDLILAFECLEQQDNAKPLSEAVVPELARIHQRFNTMAERLRASIQTNRELSNHLVALQEDERRSLAHELHDEMGPNLFNIQVDVTTGMAQLEKGDKEGVRERLESIELIVSQVQVQTREMISKLRPLVLEEMSLNLVLEDLVEKWQRRYRQVNWQIDVADSLDDLNDALTITVYRIVQECLTNIAKHASARNVSIRISRHSQSIEGQGNGLSCNEFIELQASDDGIGRATGVTWGFGLRGMGERVKALGGTFEVCNDESGGFLVKACIPIR